ncbi:MAG: PKD domain-containing protein [Syntrophales bacterium]|nr:PKD domain-containing protein [Syntrophales bacterium]
MSGLTGSGTTTVAVKENIPPECTIEATDYPDRKYTKLLSKCTDEDGRIRSWSWDLGNGQTKNTGTVYATYAESGTYTVSLTATDDSGSSVTVSQDVSAQR